jgi:hypothetical protein
MSVFLGLRGSVKAAGTHRISANAFNIAEAGKEHALSLLRRETVSLHPGTDTLLLDAISFDIGSYSVRCSTNDKIDTVYLKSKGTAGDQTVTIFVKCWRHTVVGLMNCPGPAAVLCKSKVEVLGNIAIDGNDWDSTGSKIVGPGVFGITTGGTDTIGGSAVVSGKGFVDTCSSSKGKGGGGKSGKSICASAGDSIPHDSVVQRISDTTKFPRTPEQALGLKSGALDSFKVSSFPAAPFHKIIYVDSAGPKIGYNFNNSSGIFIYHNSSYTATLKNIQGNFKGILICDQVDHINDSAKVLGRIITLANNPVGNCFGNGAASIRYSAQILTNLDNYCGTLPFFIDIAAWKEL